MDEKPYTILDWDTKHFGFKTARLLPEQCLQSGLEQALARLRNEGASLAYLFIPEGQEALYQQALVCGGNLVDEKRTYRGSLSNIATDPPPSEVKPYLLSEPHLDLLELALESGRFSRFQVDPLFPKECFRQLYQEWMLNSLSGELAKVVLVIPQKENIIGMVTVGAKGNRADIGLIAVSGLARGRGLGSALVRAAANWGLQAGFQEGQVLTQGANTEACRLYTRCGYTLEKSERVFHFWL